MRRLLATLLLAVTALPAPAASATTESIERLLVATRAEAMSAMVLSQMEQQMRQGMKAATESRPPTPEQQRELDTTLRETMAVLREELAWGSMKALYVEIYRDSFTQEEIDGLVAFYTSPAGKAFIEKMPVVMQKTMAATQARMKPVFDKITAGVEKARSGAKAAR